MEEARVLNLVESTAEAFSRLEAECRQQEYFFVEAALRAIRLDIPGFQWKKQEAGNGEHGKAAVPQAELIIDLDDDDDEDAPQHVHQEDQQDEQHGNAVGGEVEVDKHMVESTGFQVKAEVEKTAAKEQDGAAGEDDGGVGEGGATGVGLRELRSEEDCSCSPALRRSSMWDIAEVDAAGVGLGGAGGLAVAMREKMLNLRVSLGLDVVNFDGPDLGRGSCLPLSQLPGALTEAESCEVGLVVKAPTCVYMVEGRMSRMASRESAGTVKFAVERFSKQAYVRDAECSGRPAWHDRVHRTDAGSKAVENVGRLEVVEESDGLEGVEDPVDSVIAALTELLEESDAELGAEAASQSPRAISFRESGGIRNCMDWQGVGGGNRMLTNPRESAGSMDWQAEAENPEQVQNDVDIDMLPQEVTVADHPHPLLLMQSPYADDPYNCDACGHGGDRWAYHCNDCGFDVHPECATGPSTEQKPAEERSNTQGQEDEQDEHQVGFICDEEALEPDSHGQNYDTDDEGQCREKEAACRGGTSLRYSGAIEKMSGLGSSVPMDIAVTVGDHPLVSVEHPATEPGEAENSDIPKQKRPNVVERGSIRSFLPFLKQQPAPPTARPVKVWALEAAHAVRRQEEQKALERKMRKEYQKLLKDQQMEERAKQLREDVRQMKDYARQMKKDDTQKKDKRVNEQRVDREKLPEQSMSLQDSDVGSKGVNKLSVTTATECTSKKKQFTSTDSTKLVLADCSNTFSSAQAKVNRVLEAKQRIDLEKARKLEEDMKRKEELRRKGPELAAKKRARQETEKKYRDVKRKTLKETLLPYRENIEKQVQVELKDQEMAGTSKCNGLRDAGLDARQPQPGAREDKCTPQPGLRPLAALDLGPQSYEISPYRGSSDDEDEDENLPEKPIPLWARSEHLLPQLIAQRHVDPDEIFTSAKTCSLKEVFATNGSKKKSDWGRRSFSGNWLEDRVSRKEELQYKEMMGYAIPVQTIPEHRS